MSFEKLAREGGLVQAAIGKEVLKDQQRLTIDLGTARSNELLSSVMDSDFLLVESISSGASCSIRLNGPSEPPIDLTIYKRIVKSKENPISSIYVTNTAQTGKSVVLALGGDSSFMPETNPVINSIVNPVELVVSSSIVHGQKTVAAAGTAEALGASTTIKAVLIKALSTNTGLIYVGSASVTSANGYPLTAGEPVAIETDDLANVYLNSAVNGEGVRYLGVA